MTATAHVYGLAIQSLTSKLADLGTDTLKVMLLTSVYTPNQGTHQYQSDLTNEVTGTGYTAGGQALVSVTKTYNTGTKTWTLDASDTVWAASTLTARYAVVYDASPGTTATNPLLCYLDFGVDIPSAGGNYTVQWDPAGIITQTVS